MTPQIGVHAIQYDALMKGFNAMLAAGDTPKDENAFMTLLGQAAGMDAGNPGKKGVQPARPKGKGIGKGKTRRFLGRPPACNRRPAVNNRGAGPALTAGSENKAEAAAADCPAEDDATMNGNQLVLCSRCNCMEQRNKCQIDAKNTFKCNTCNSKMVSLYRTYGSWPTEEFKSLDKEAQDQFYQSIKNVKGKKMQQYVEESLQKRMSDYKDEYNEYEYHPLGYYERLGYDTQAIQEHCTDKREHKYLGMTYRVNIDKGREGQLNERVRTSEVMVKPAKGSGKGSGKGGGKGKQVQKPPKKTAEEKKEEAEEKKEEQRKTKNLQAAKGALAKTDDVYTKIHGLVATDCKIQQVGQWVVDACSKLKELRDCAELTIHSDGDSSFPYSKTEILNRRADAVEASKVVMRLNKVTAQKGLPLEEQ